MELLDDGYVDVFDIDYTPFLGFVCGFVLFPLWVHYSIKPKNITLILLGFVIFPVVVLGTITLIPRIHKLLLTVFPYIQLLIQFAKIAVSCCFIIYKYRAFVYAFVVFFLIAYAIRKIKNIIKSLLC